MSMSSWRLPILTIKYLISWKFLQFLFNYNKISAYNILSPPVKMNMHARTHHVFICRWIQIKNYQQINFQRKINLLNNHKLTSIHLHHSYLCIHTHAHRKLVTWSFGCWRGSVRHYNQCSKRNRRHKETS